MSDIGIAGLVLIIITIAFSYKGFNDRLFYEKHRFEVGKILLYKQYRRLVTSGFLHVSWMHLILNMISLLLFSGFVESAFGPLRFIAVYFASMVGGDLLALFIHRNHSRYSSVGASGAVCGIIFASIALSPQSHIGMLFLPFSIPAWIYGLLYVLYSMYGIRSRRDNIGHEAHLGGALVGMCIALIMFPGAFAENYVPILLISLPTLAFIILILTRPHLLLIDNLFYKKQHDFYSIDHKYNAEKRNAQNEIDRILDKINQRGMKSLTEKERKMLEEYSKKH
jgi:membrane associated rhomboid family serine protease